MLRQQEISESSKHKLSPTFSPDPTDYRSLTSLAIYERFSPLLQSIEFDAVHGSTVESCRVSLKELSLHDYPKEATFQIAVNAVFAQIPRHAELTCKDTHNSKTIRSLQPDYEWFKSSPTEHLIGIYKC